MAIIYVRSTDGDNGDDGSTWALAKADLTGACAIDSAGDTIYLSQAHAESTGASLTFNLAGTHAAPSKVIAVNDAAEPPTSVATATITTTGASSITFAVGTNGAAHIYGLICEAGTGSSGGGVALTSNTLGEEMSYENCKFRCNTTSSAALIATSNASLCKCVLRNCDMKFGATSQGINANGDSQFIWSGGAIESGSSAITVLLRLTSGFNAFFLIEGVDLSNGATAMHLVSGASSSATGRFIFRNCKLPSGWSGSLMTSPPSQPFWRVELWNCDTGDTNYRMAIADGRGEINTETTIVKTGGASDGTTTISHKFVTSSSALFIRPLVGPEMVKHNTTVGSAVTVTVDIVHDSATNLTDAEVWLDVQYLGTSGVPLSLFAHDAIATILTTPADQASSAVTWTTTGMTNPNKQKLSVQFTPQEIGYIHAQVRVGKASYTVYVDPELQVS